MSALVRFALLSFLSLGFPSLSRAAEQPNRLSDQDAAAGWLLLFDGASTFGWKVEGNVSVNKDGALVIGGPKGGAITSTMSFGAGELRYQISSNDDDGFIVWHDQSRAIPENDKADSLSWRSIKTKPSPIRIEIPADDDDEDRIVISQLRFLPTDLEPIFNGKDLAGWKVFEDEKRSASKWTVTDQGELHVVNGPGDLQTKEKYGDFVLQLECKTNGDGLNSGIFFRCNDYQYQNGYECQINNAMIDNDRSKPKDAGTGAIYRRVDARRIVAKDREWFTLTLIAHGKQISTWVNGYPTADWIDDRPADENPRKGARTQAGHLSIQGHDPTTDILFRNIRIVELKEKFATR